jgi:capsular exopolysaccharide synthesis family protein
MSRFYDLLKTAGGSGALDNAIEAPPPQPALPDIEALLAGSAPPLDIATVATTVNGIAPIPVLRQEIAVPPDEPAGEIVEDRAQSVPLVFPAKIPVLTNAANTAVMEYYRRLRTKVLHLREARMFRTLVVTSPEPQDGKTLTTLNMALSFAMVPSFRIAVVDADLRRGSLGGLLGTEDRPGFNNLIDGSASLHDVVYRAKEQGLYYIGRGNSKEPPGELLQSSRVAGVCRRLGEEFDLVLLDSPPVNIVADTHLLVTHCDAVLLIARAFATTKKAFEKAVQEVQHCRIIGTVLNGASRPRSYRGYRGYAGYY